VIAIPRSLIAAFTGLFSAYLVVTAVFSLFQGEIVGQARVTVAIALYVVAILALLVPGRSLTAPLWSASVAFGVSLAVMILVAWAVDPTIVPAEAHTTWYVAGIGTLMTGVVIRRRPLLAWAGIGALAAHTTVWAGPTTLVSFGVTGAAAAVGAAHILTAALAQADRDAERYVVAERDAADWQAAQEARLMERQGRIAETERRALPMLRLIIERKGRLSSAEREDSRHLEAEIRDEIRGRRLLDSGVRAAVRRARRRGVEVTMLDDGGIDELPAEQLPRIHAEISRALDTADAERVIVRTVPEGSATAVTVVGLRSGSAAARLLGQDADDEMALWVEIPRTGGIPAPRTSSHDRS